MAAEPQRGIEQLPGGDDAMDDELEVYGDVPQARFGHTITLVSSSKVVLFGGATGDTGKYIMTGDTFLFNILTKSWTKLAGKIPHSCSSREGRASQPEGGAQLDQC